MQKPNRFAILQDETEGPDLASQPQSFETSNPENAEEMPVVSLSQLFLTGTRYFWQLVAKINDDRLGDAVPVTLISRTSDEYSRLKIWGQQTRIIVDPRTRSSLEESLRDDTGIRKVVADALRQLTEEIQSALRVLDELSEGHYSAEVSTGLDTLSQISDDTDDSENADASPLLKLVVVLNDLSDDIQQLYRLSNLLRRPRLTDRYLRSVSKNQERKALPVEYIHVREKFAQWYNEENGIDPLSLEEQDCISQDAIQIRQNNDDSSMNVRDVLCRRLARANERRRDQLRYWAAHPYKRPEEAPPSIIPSTFTSAVPDKDILTKKQPEVRVISDIPSTTIQQQLRQEIMPKRTQNEEDNDAQSHKPPPTAHSFSTVAMSAVFERQTSGSKEPDSHRTVYAPTQVGGIGAIRVPDIPIESASREEFECPYCHMMLISSEMRHRAVWKRHVFRDLRPYTCTFSQCTSADKLYATRRDWLYHEMQVHRRQWACRDCDELFESEDAMVDHSSTLHGETWTNHQTVVLLDMSEVPMDETKRATCLICLYEDFLNRVMEHLARHMEDLALFALPKYVPGDENLIGNKSNLSLSNAGRGLRSLESRADDLSSVDLTWSVIGDSEESNGHDEEGEIDVASEEKEKDKDDDELDDDELERIIREMEEEDARREAEQAAISERKKAEAAEAKKKADAQKVEFAAENDRTIREQERVIERLEEERERSRQERESSGGGKSVAELLKERFGI